MRRLAWRAASGGTAATSPPRSSMGERRKWRPVRRARAADEKNDFRNVNIGVLRLFVLSRAAFGEESRERRNREEGRGAGAFLGDTDDRLRAWHGRARPRPAGAGRRSAAYGRVQAPEQCGRCPDRVKKRAGCGKRKGKRAEESVPADRADAGSARPGIQCCGFRTDQDAPGRSARREWTGQTGMPAPRAGAIEARGLRH